ncbi:hypothetical protein C1Y05_28885 [Pseudomonas sp. FW306-02-F04-BA]|nr:hypothetical protein C1Y05_28885 [Pseudomonas sp. FW306-02-F04-BA]
MWRGSLLPLGCAAVVTSVTRSSSKTASNGVGTASRSSGSKLPRHKVVLYALESYGSKLSSARFTSNSPSTTIC